jgi:hypothetical protein
MTLTTGTSMRARLSLSLLMAAAFPKLVAAQWSVAPELGIVSFGRSARDTAAGLDLGPTSATAFGFRVARSWPRMGIALRFRYGTSGLAATDGNITVIQEHAFKLYDISSLASWRLAEIAVGTTLQLEAGPVLSIWKAKGGESRARAGVSAALALRIGMGPRYIAAIRVEGGVSPSVFDATDVPTGVERRTAWRRGLAIAIGRRF